VADNNRIVTSDLDFTNIKTNLQNFLQGQSELSDYNFDGSTLSILLDVLSYNTHYNALYTNLAVNESFLDSAVKRDSAVSRAFELGYLPRSSTASSVNINLTCSGISGNPSILVLPALTPFTTTFNGTNFTFYNTSSYTVSNNNNIYYFNGIKIIEGTPLTQSYTVSSGSRYLISNVDCDISTLNVNVYNNAHSSNSITYTKVTDILDVKSTDTVYFIKEVAGGLYEIQFGNDRIGKSLTNGNVIVLSYVVTNMDAANGARTFISPNVFGGTSYVSSVGVSAGGAQPESADEIKFNAPRVFSSGNRVVTTTDYKALLTSEFPNINSIQVWGGEDNLPPVYGKVFISIAPISNAVLTTNEKTIITTLLKNKSVVTISPVFVDPSYLNIHLTTTVYFNPNTTTLLANDIKLLVTSTILDYNVANLGKFDSIFRFSKLSTLIDGVDNSVSSNISMLTVSRDVDVMLNTLTNYSFNINNPIYTAGVKEHNVQSNGFYVQGDSNINYITDDGLGNLHRYSLDVNNNIVLTNSSQGTVDYKSGIIFIRNLQINNLTDNNLTFTLKLLSNDVISIRDNIVSIDTASLIVNVVPISDIPNASYTFSASK
jgi:hypothetical protein